MFIGLIRHNITPATACITITVSGPDELISKTEYESFTVSAGVLTGNGLSYQWQRKYPAGSWLDISGATSSTYTESGGLDISQSNTQYRCNITNTCSSATSRIITVEVLGLPPPPPPP